MNRIATGVVIAALTLFIVCLWTHPAHAADSLAKVRATIAAHDAAEATQESTQDARLKALEAAVAKLSAVQAPQPASVPTVPATSTPATQPTLPAGVAAKNLGTVYALKNATPPVTRFLIGRDPLPAGDSLSGKVLTIDSPTPLDGWDLRGVSIYTGPHADGFVISNSLLKLPADSSDYLVRLGEGGPVTGTFRNVFADFTATVPDGGTMVTRAGTKLILDGFIADNASDRFLSLGGDSDIRNSYFGRYGINASAAAHLEAIKYDAGNHVLQDTLIDTTGAVTPAGASGDIFVSPAAGAMTIDVRRTIMAGVKSVNGLYTFQARSDYGPFTLTLTDVVLQPGTNGAPTGYFGNLGSAGKITSSGVVDFDTANAVSISLGGIAVSTTDQLLAALAKVQPGDTISLAPGRYDGLRFSGLRFSPVVTITAADPANRPVLTNFLADSDAGLTFKGVDLQGIAGSTWSFSVRDGQAITFDHVRASAVPGGNPLEPPGGFAISNVSGLTVTSSEFSGLSTALSMANSPNLTITGNHFHDLRADAIDFSQSDHTYIAGNYIHDLFIVAGDHPDAIQLWTLAGGGPMTDVTVSFNLIVRGTRPDAAHLQGIFFNTDQGPVNGFTANGNFLAGTGYNGLVAMSDVSKVPPLPAASNVNFTSNTILTFDEDSRIRLEHVTGGAVSGNAAIATIDVGNTGVTWSGNTTNQLTTPAAAAGPLAAWLAAHPSMAWTQTGKIP